MGHAFKSFSGYFINYLGINEEVIMQNDNNIFFLTKTVGSLYIKKRATKIQKLHMAR